MKIGKSRSIDKSRREVEALRSLGTSKIVPEVFDMFDVEGHNGIHACYTMSVAAGDLARAKNDSVFSPAVARALSAKLAQIVFAMHSHGYCHGSRFGTFEQSTIILTPLMQTSDSVTYLWSSEPLSTILTWRDFEGRLAHPRWSPWNYLAMGNYHVMFRQKHAHLYNLFTGLPTSIQSRMLVVSC
jgi:hypothetical protein